MPFMAFPPPSVRPPVPAKIVLEALSKHMLVDGYHVVMDLKASRGNFLRDSLRGVEILTSIRTSRPARSDTPTRRRRRRNSWRSWGARPSRSPPTATSTPCRWRASSRRSRAPRRCPNGPTRGTCCSSRAALSRNENALKAAFDWKVRRNSARATGARWDEGPLAPRAGFPRPQRLALPSRTRATRGKTMYFRVRLAARREPEAHVSLTRRASRRRSP